MKGALTMGEDAKLTFDEPDAAEEQAAEPLDEGAERIDYLEQRLGLTREIAEGEVSIAKWAGGDPTRALQIATRICEDRGYLLRQQASRAAVVAAEIAEHQRAIDGLQAWLDAAAEADQKRIRWYDHLLTLYQLDFHDTPQERTKAGNLKTSLPYGVEIERTVNRPKRVWRDEKAALAWAMDSHRGAVRVKYELDKRLALEQLEEQADGTFLDPATGEVVDFVVMEAPETPESVVVKQSIE